MKRLNGNIRPADGAVSETPEVLQSVRMHLAANVFNGMIYHLMSVLGFQAVIRKQGVTVERSTRLYVRLDFSLQSFLFAVWYYHCNYFAVFLTVFRFASIATLKDAHYRCFVCRAGTSNASRLYVFVHV